MTNYKLNDIEEGNNTGLIKHFNLNDLVNEIKSEEGDLENLVNITESSFTFEDLMKIVIFTMNEKVDNIKTNNFIFNFTIKGKLNKEISQISLKRGFTLIEIDTKANCKFTIGENKTADLSCFLNVEKHKNIKTFSFKTSQIITDTNEIYLSKFIDILLINSDSDNRYTSNNSDKSIIIIICSIISVVGAGLVGISIYLLIKKHKKANQKEVTEEKNQNKGIDKNVSQSHNAIKFEGSTEQRVRSIKNKKL